ncbi:potassium channel family protein [Streptomyces sp. NPDC086989]|uniref:potassium channel family protein n=1 Tax=Streptomyces sp. NPDC086989 TaxID=3365764 RepID=UPI0038238351
MKEPSRQLRWERRSQTPLLVLAVAFAVAYAVPIVVPDANTRVHRACTVTEWVVWGAFAADYLMRLGLSTAKRAFVRTHWLDLGAVLLPMFQPLRLLRLVSTLLLVGRRARMAPQIRLTTYVAGAVVGLLMFGSLAVLSVERDAPGGNIRNLGDAVWWSFTTMTTVGYGDHSPTTGLGRIIAVGLMLSGIALLGVVTANIAAWFISRFELDDQVERAQTAAIAELSAEVRALRAEIGRLGGTPAVAPEARAAAPEAGAAAPAPEAGAASAPGADPGAEVTPGAETAPGAGAGVPALVPGTAPAAGAASAPTP